MTGNPFIKHTAITRAGYEYQDLVGIEILIRHYRDPNLFSWVKLESDDPKIKSLDDVVAMRSDGSVEYVQVKFTVDAEKYPLDWEWLLEKSKNGTSLLAKWAEAFARAKLDGPIHSAQLKTNRIPSPDFSASMRGNFVDLALVPVEIRKRVEAECGGETKAEEFFSEFAFTGNLPDLERLESSLRDQLVPTDTEGHGWLLLCNSVRRWAIRKKEPPPDGKILRHHLFALISRQRPQPLRQDFVVPEGYTPPNDDFDRQVRNRIFDNATPISVLWGTPGRGKSTYLSYLTTELRRLGEAVIRHHYFISSEDTNSNRTSFFDIANSLTDQLMTRHPEATAGLTDSNDLHQILRATAENLAESGKRLFLIVDGLDHVYRDTQRADQLNHLFNEILPLAPNVTLIVGTQRVEDQQLPGRLLTFAAEPDWIEIPRMDQVAVRHWIQTQDAARPLVLKFDLTGDRRAEEIEGVAAAMFKLSQGHPLYLIYAYEGLVRTGKPVSTDDIEALPICPDGDIRTYYKSLWVRLSPQAKSILHMLAGTRFFWPSSGIRQCIGDYGEIDFLLEPRNSGMIPFHASIFAWIRERDDHAESYAALLPKIALWLENDSPEFWRWGWLWLVKAESGKPEDLLAGVTREWAIESVARGWPEWQIMHILAAAEKGTFTSGNLPETIRLRSLKTRVSNMRQFQAVDFGFFQATGLAISDNRQGTLNLLDDFRELSDEEITRLAQYGPPSSRGEAVQECFAELARRVNSWVDMRHRPGHEFAKLSDHLLTVAALAGVRLVPSILEYLSQFEEGDQHYSRYIGFLGEGQDIDALLAVKKVLCGRTWSAHRGQIQEHILSAALFKGADPSALIEEGEELTPATAAWFLKEYPAIKRRIHLTPVPKDLLRERYTSSDTGDIERFLYDSFWTALCVNLRAAGDFSYVYPGLSADATSWIRRALTCLERAARDLANQSIPFAFSTIYDAASSIAAVPFSGRIEQDHAQYLGFRKCLGKIALELHLMGLADKHSPLIPCSELLKVRKSPHWEDELWVSKNAQSQIKFLDQQGAALMLAELCAELSDKVSVFNERAEKWAQYASLVALYDAGDAFGLIRRAADCLLSYGWRKDLGAIEVLDAIEHVHKSDPSKTMEWIAAVTPGVDAITEFTDGDETDHVRSQLIETVSETIPDRLPLFYEHHLGMDEWRYSDECLEAMVAIVDLSSPEGQALARTLLDSRMLDALERRIKTEPIAQYLLDRQIRFLGGRPVPRRDYAVSDEKRTPEQEAVDGSDPTVFGPDDFAGLIDFVSTRNVHYNHRGEFMAKWLSHWHGKGKARRALASITAYFASGAPTYSADEILDKAFEVSLAVEGKAVAYKWIVQAHVQRHGWLSYYTSEKEIMDRLLTVARVYPERWMDYLRDSSTIADSYSHRGYGFAIGYRYLVRFLLLVGQVTLATAITDVFVSNFIVELNDQPVPETRWLQ
jgi:hypothetical protein